MHTLDSPSKAGPCLTVLRLSAKRKKPDIHGYTVNDSIYTKHPEQANPLSPSSRSRFSLHILPLPERPLRSSLS